MADAVEAVNHVTLRDYQERAVEAASEHVDAGRNPVIVLPTGAGKSLVIAALAHRYRDRGVLALAHRRELIAQNAAAYAKLSGRRPNVLCADLDSFDTAGPVLFASVQTAASRLRHLDRFGLLLVDECHLIPPDDGSQYQRVIGAMDGALVVGLSATPYRLGAGTVVDHPNIPLDVVAINVEARELVEKGYLSPLILDERRVAAIDAEKVRKRGGEFVLSELDKAAAVRDLVRRQMEIARLELEDRRSVLIFCVSKEHARMVAAELEATGESVAVVTEDTPPRERDLALQYFRSGGLRWITNVDLLTTGFDAPGIDGIVVLRPTLSKALFVQMVGRGYRLAPGKANCHVLDFGGNIARHRPLDEFGALGMVEGSVETAEREADARRATWHDRVLREEIDLGECRVVAWKPHVEASKSCPGTAHVRLGVLVEPLDPEHGKRWINLWYTPEHRNRFARYRAQQLARRLGWTGYALSAHELGALLQTGRPSRMLVRCDNKGFWRATW